MEQQPTTEAPFEEWGVVEIMGHKRLAGKLSERTLAGSVFLRVDIPAPDGTFTTQFYGGQSIYCISPVSEAAARAVAARLQPEPVYRYEIPQLQAATHPTVVGDGDGEYTGDGEHDDDIERMPL